MKPFLLSVFALLALPVYSNPYIENHKKECSETVNFFITNKSKFEQIAGKSNFNAKFLFAIVAPELTQFIHLKDKLETYSLKVFYVQGGKEYSNFSIGMFQMKPSFIEQMEESLQASEDLKSKYEKCLIKNPNSREARVERVNRLMQTEWQLEYLALFCEIVRKQFAPEQNLSEEELLSFYATAYNTGFHKSKESIDKMAQQANFPHFSKKKYKYSDISLWFYQNCDGKL